MTLVKLTGVVVGGALGAHVVTGGVHVDVIQVAEHSAGAGP